MVGLIKWKSVDSILSLAYITGRCYYVQLKGETKMLNIYICEDNKEQREYLAACVSEIIEEENFQFHIACTAADPYAILDAIKDEMQAGIFFLDIDLNSDMNGIELASEIRKKQPRCYIIFITTHAEMSYMTFSYKVEAMDFIIKDNVGEIKTRVHQCLINCHHLSDQLPEDVSKNYLVKMGDKVKAVPYDDILCFEVSANSRKIILYAKNCQIEFGGKLKEIENNLDSRFHRCHRSFIVNKENITKIDREENMLTLCGGLTCPFSVRMGKGLR